MAFDNVGPGLMAARRFRPVRALPLLLLVALAACSGAVKKPPTGTPEPDRFLFERGTEQLNSKHWLTSREYFRQLVDSYPQSPFRADAKLGVGDTTSAIGRVVRPAPTSSASSSRSTRRTPAPATRSSSWG